MLLLAAAALATAPLAGHETLAALLSIQFVGNVRYEQQLAAAKDLQVKNVRLAARAGDVVNRLGRYNWELLDSRIGPLMRSGVRPIITIFGVPPVSGAVDGAAGLNAPAYATFAAEVVKHFGTESNGRPILYELWNEPNTKTFWGSPPNPEAYASLATAACNAIKRASPNAVVVGLAMEGTPVKAPYFVTAYNIDIYQQWAARAYTQQLAQCIDGVSIHPYRSKPETYLNDEPQFQSFIGRSWRKSTPPMIVNSEWGYAVASQKGVSVDDQAALDVRAALIGASFRRLTNIYMAVDPAASNAPANDGYGLITNQGSEKPSAKAIKTLLKEVGGFAPEPARELAEHPGVFEVRMTANGPHGQRRAVAVWSAGSETTLAVADIQMGGAFHLITLGPSTTSRTASGDIIISSMPVIIAEGH